MIHLAPRVHYHFQFRFRFRSICSMHPTDSAHAWAVYDVVAAMWASGGQMTVTCAGTRMAWHALWAVCHVHTDRVRSQTMRARVTRSSVEGRNRNVLVTTWWTLDGR